MGVRAREQADAIVACLDDWVPDRGGLLVFVKAYIDRGQRPDADGIMAIGCALFAPTPYKQFVRGWKAHLAALGGVPYIHSTDFYGGWGIYSGLSNEKRAEVAALLPATIRSHVKAHMVVSFKADEFEAVAGSLWKDRFGSMYTTAVQIAMSAIGHWATQNNYNGKVSYFYESGDLEEPELASRLASLSDKLRRHTRMLTAAPMPKGSARGLEVADVLAWQWNKFYAESMARDGLPGERKPRKDFQALFGDGRGPKPMAFLFTGQQLEQALTELWDPDQPIPDLWRAATWQEIRAHIGTGPKVPIHQRPWR